MNAETIYRPLIEKFFEKDMSAAIHVFEGMTEESAADKIPCHSGVVNKTAMKGMISQENNPPTIQ